MKIALVGEYSGLHLGLKRGLEELGHEVDVYSDGDGFKAISSNKVLYPKFNGRIDQINYAFRGLPRLLDYISNNYDIIQLANPNSINSHRGISSYYKYLINILKKSKAIKSLAVAGCETHTQQGLAEMERSPCPGCLREDKRRTCKYISNGYQNISKYAEEFADRIIAFGGPSYARSYVTHKNYCDLVPFPLDATEIPRRDNYVNGKIKILHGINRAGFKGSDVILTVLRQVVHEYPSDFELIVPEKLPFDNYIKLLSKVNVVVDQLYGDGLGMNALYSMASSCIVFTSFDRIHMGKLDLKSTPALQIKSNPEDIYNQIIELRKWNEEKLVSTGKDSRYFVEFHNSPAGIARQVLECWNR